MTNENFAPQQTIIEILKTKPRTVSAEIIPPRNGMETQTIFNQIERLRGAGVDFIAVTKRAGGSLRGGTLPLAQLVRSSFGVCSLAHFTCRDYTKEEIENNLMDHHYFGIRNILALRGDPPDGQPGYFQPSPNRHTYAYQLVEQIRALNAGRYLHRDGFDDKNKERTGQPTKFCIGVAAHPEHAPLEQGVEYFQRKIEAGAQYGITQMLFSADPYKRFVEALAKRGLNVPILPGVRIITSAQTAERMRNKFSDVSIPDSLIEKLTKAHSKEAAREVGMNATLELCQELLKAGAPGIHIFVMSDTGSACELISALR
ncbi:MAG TPA: methylenetetrahydrofolate reductase [Oligoflexia bacterium]|nr:methylenetetrahydrofolate reductase [Oligoflexia bacterium]